MRIQKTDKNNNGVKKPVCNEVRKCSWAVRRHKISLVIITSP